MSNFLGHLVAIGLPSAMFYFFSIIPLRRVYRARAWLETPCVVLSSAVEENVSESGVYRILVTYNYEVAGVISLAPIRLFRRRDMRGSREAGGSRAACVRHGRSRLR